MLKFRFDLIVFFLMIINSGVVAQTTSELILPKDLNGIVKFNISSISSISNLDKETLAYHYLSVYVKNKAERYTSNAIQGQHTREGDYLVFKPYFPFESGMTYTVRTKNTIRDSLYSYQSFQIGKKKRTEKAMVLSIYPLSNQLPENLLRFYIYFNTPMKKGQALKHIQLIDAEGNVDKHAFMEFKQELWSADGKRLTILFDPGRIKRGVSTNRQQGPALLKGKRYQLSISGAWQDVYGQKIALNTKKEFEVLNAYRHHMKINDWAIDKPKANSNDILTIYFDRIIDHALILSMIKIIDAKDKFLTGHWEILEEERSIKFISKKKWKKGNYRIIIDSRLEDITGNNLQNLLDHNKTDKENNSQPHQYIDFKIYLLP